MRWKRTELLIGNENTKILEASHVLLFGLGGVGGYAFEALVRSGVGELTLVDCDSFDITNCNRQILALEETVGRDKCEVAKERALAINPKLKIHLHSKRVTGENIPDFFEGQKIDYVIDAIDTVTAKLGIIQYAYERDIPVISSMGTARKWNPSFLEVTDIKKTSVCPLARVMRRELKKRGVHKCKVVYSKEEAKVTGEDLGSMIFVPAVAGLYLAQAIVKDLCSLDAK